MKTYLAIFILLALTNPLKVAASSFREIHNQAWNDKTGWIDFNCTDCNVTISGTNIVGKINTEKLGSVILNPSSFGVKNNGRGILRGAAWGTQTGWIDFKHARINANGIFEGKASGPIIGDIYFSCNGDSKCGSKKFTLQTTWRDNIQKPSCSNGLDDDNDGKIDYPEDPQCESASDNSESLGWNTSNGTFKKNETLRLNDKNEAVKKLQNFLNKNGFPVRTSGAGSLGKETTKFGPSTKQALIKFQNHYKKEILTPHGLSHGTGIFGPSTIEFVNSLITKSQIKPITTTLQIGDKNESVRELQKFLNQNGFPITSSGAGSLGKETTKFGPATEQALIKFQTKYKKEILTPFGLTKATGICGPSTLKFIKNFKTNKPNSVINVSAVFNTNLAIGMKNNDVTRLQKLLKTDKSIYPEGITNGNFGELTKKAVQRFQSKYKIANPGHPAYGYVGPSTRAKLKEVF